MTSIFCLHEEKLTNQILLNTISHRCLQTTKQFTGQKNLID